MTRAVVTGAAGFVGRHLVEHLRSCGDEVVTSDRATDGLDVVDAEAVSALMGDARPDVVYHLAGWSDVGGSWDHPEAALTANVLGTEAVLRACARHGVERTLVVTSADVYGSVPAASQPIEETTPLRPESPYAASKAAAEMVAVQAGVGRGLDVVRARAFNHAGPGQRSDFVVPALTDRLLDAVESGASTVAVGALEPTRDFTDVRDVVRAYRLLVEHGRGGEAYNVCSGTEIAIAALLDLLIEICGARVTPVTDPARLRQAEVSRRVGSSAKLSAATGWSPSFSLARTLADVVDERRSIRAATRLELEGE